MKNSERSYRSTGSRTMQDGRTVSAKTRNPTIPLSQGELEKLWRQYTLGGSNSSRSTYRPANQSQGTAKTKEKKFLPAVPAAILSGFECKQELGKGGMGVVYKARQRSLNRDIAVKKLKQESQLNLDSQSCFLSEAYTTALLDHPNIVPVYDLSQTDKSDMELAMKIVSGQSWNEIIGELSLVENIQILIKICDGLRYAHSRNIVHIDIKPSNIMIGAYGEVYIMDWGLALSFGLEHKTNSPIRHRSQLLGPCGTPCYMAPELADGRKDDIGPWTDVYLLGSVLHELITGQPPHRGGNFFEIIIAASQSEPKSFHNDVPDALKEICQRCLSANPKDRPHSVSDFQNRLLDFLNQRESIEMTTKAYLALEECEQTAQKINAIRKNLSSNPIYLAYDRAVGLFRQAQMLWLDNDSAHDGEDRARTSYSKLALKLKDLNLAEAQISKVSSPQKRLELKQQLESIRQFEDRKVTRQRQLRIVLLSAVGFALIVATYGVGRVRSARIQSEEQKEIARSATFVANQSAQRAKGELKKSKTRIKGITGAFEILVKSVHEELGLLPGPEYKKSRETLLDAAMARINSNFRKIELLGLPLDNDALNLYLKNGEFAIKRGKTRDAHIIFLKALEIAKTLNRRGPNQATTLSLANSQVALATSHFYLGNAQKAVGCLDQASTTASALVSIDSRIYVDLRVNFFLALIAETKSQNEKAIAHFKQVIRSFQKIFKTTVDGNSLVANAEISFRRLILLIQNSESGSVSVLSEAQIEIARKNYESHPLRQSSVHWLNVALRDHVSRQLKREKYLKAIDSIDERQAIIAKYEKVYRGHPYSMKNFAEIHGRKAYVQVKLGRLRLARQNFQTAVRFSQRFVKLDSSEVSLVSKLATISLANAQELTSKNKDIDALHFAQVAVELLESVPELNKSDRGNLKSANLLVQRLEQSLAK